MRLTQPATHGSESLPRPDAPLWTSGEMRLLDEAIDYAARICQGTVCEFLAGPSNRALDGSCFIEMAIEFFIPPTSLIEFANELDRAMIRRSLAYSSARRSGNATPVRVTALSPSVFHQWRMAWKIDPKDQRKRRWSPDRQMLDQILLYANDAWREHFTA
jgi:hypothetical protein